MKAGTMQGWAPQPGECGGSTPKRAQPHTWERTSDSRRMLRFSLLPDLVPFPLVDFWSGMVTSGAGRGASMRHADLKFPPRPPEVHGLGEANCPEVEEKQLEEPQPGVGILLASTGQDVQARNEDRGPGTDRTREATGRPM